MPRDGSGELGFANKRSAAWWHLRELLDPAGGHQIALPPDDLLTGDVTAPHWRMTSSGKIQVESKEEIKKRLGRSPDDGDAVVMAFWEKPAAADLIYRDYIDEYAPQRQDGSVDRSQWQEGIHGYLVREFAIPATWPRYVGIAFGGTRDTALDLVGGGARHRQLLLLPGGTGGRSQRSGARATSFGIPGERHLLGGRGAFRG